jgi:hypothetical protein
LGQLEKSLTKENFSDASGLDKSADVKFVEKLGLKESEEHKKSFVERMRSDKTKGKSLGGSNEL